MKKIITAFCLIAIIEAGAQTQEGKVIYERTTQVRRPQGIPDNITIPPVRREYFELMFVKQQSLWQNIPNPEGDNNTVSTPGMVFRMGGTSDIFYFDLNLGTRVEQREILDKEFLVEDSIAKLSWVNSDETKTVLGHSTRKATALRVGTRRQVTMENGQMKSEQVPDSATITAWYSPDIPVQAGPQDFSGQLPGLILELSLNNGRTVYKAVELSAKVNASKIKAPRGGKKVTAAAFVLEREKMIDEMRQNAQQGNRVIRMNTN
ncbi:MAG: GLPGLI family protein [Chitinophagaceae bacterium]